MPGGSHGYRAALVRRRLTPGRISSLPVTGGLPLSISFSTSCPELESTGRGSSCGGDAQRHGAVVATGSRTVETTYGNTKSVGRA